MKENVNGKFKKLLVLGHELGFLYVYYWFLYTCIMTIVQIANFKRDFQLTNGHMEMKLRRKIDYHTEKSF